jgi:hypothetical protein
MKHPSKSWICVVAALLSLSTSPGLTGQTPPGLSVVLNDAAFGPGQTMTVTARLTSIAPSRPVDAYIVVQLPNGFLLSLQMGGGLVPGLVPIASGFVPFQFTGDVAQYVVTGAEPSGEYQWLSALTEPGTLNVIGAIQTTTFTVAATPTISAAIIPNPDTNAIATISTVDGVSATFFGPKDPDGVPERITEVVATGVNGKDVRLVYNESGLPAYALVSGGGRVDFDYPAPRRFELVIRAVGHETVTLAYDPATGEVLPAADVSPRASDGAMDLVAAAASARQGRIVTTCGAVKTVEPDNPPTVAFTVAPTLRVVPLTATAVSPGVYTYDVPTQPVPSPTVMNRIAAQITTLFSDGCASNKPVALVRAQAIAVGTAIHPYVGAAVGAALTTVTIVCSIPPANVLINSIVNMSAAAGTIDVRAERGAEVVGDSIPYAGGIAFNPPDFTLSFQKNCEQLELQGQNRILGAGNWRVVFVSQEDNYALRVRTASGESELFIDEDNPLLPPLEILDSDPPFGWSVDISDWGIDPGQAYVEKTMVDENTYLFIIEVTHGVPNSPYDEAVLRFERIVP